MNREDHHHHQTEQAIITTNIQQTYTTDNKLVCTQQTYRPQEELGVGVKSSEERAISLDSYPSVCREETHSGLKFKMSILDISSCLYLTSAVSFVWPISELLLGRKVITNTGSVLKSRDITLPTKVHLVKAMVFPVVMYGFAIKKAEHQRIDAFELLLEKTLESPLDCKEIQPVHPKGDQS